MAPVVSFDLGSDAGPLAEAPFGANMAFRKSIFEEYGGFRTDLGPCPGSTIQHGEDSEMGMRVLEAGRLLLYEPSAVVYHPVSEDRMEQGYYLRWWFLKGRADIRIARKNQNTWYDLQKDLLCISRSLCWWALRWITTTKIDRRFQRKITVWNKAGAIVEIGHQLRQLVNK